MEVQTIEEFQVKNEGLSLPPNCGRCGSGLRTFYGERCSWCPDRAPATTPYGVPKCAVHPGVTANWGSPEADPQRCWNCRKLGDVHLVNPCRTCRQQVAAFGPPAAVPARCRGCRLEADQYQLHNACDSCHMYGALWGRPDEGAVRCGKCRQPCDRLRIIRACKGCALSKAHWGPPGKFPRVCQRCRQPMDSHYYPANRRCTHCNGGPAAGVCDACATNWVL